MRKVILVIMLLFAGAVVRAQDVDDICDFGLPCGPLPWPLPDFAPLGSPTPFEALTSTPEPTMTPTEVPTEFYDCAFRTNQLTDFIVVNNNPGQQSIGQAGNGIDVQVTTDMVALSITTYLYFLPGVNYKLELAFNNLGSPAQLMVREGSGDAIGAVAIPTGPSIQALNFLSSGDRVQLSLHEYGAASYVITDVTMCEVLDTPYTPMPTPAYSPTPFIDVDPIMNSLATVESYLDAEPIAIEDANGNPLSGVGAFLPEDASLFFSYVKGFSANSFGVLSPFANFVVFLLLSTIAFTAARLILPLAVMVLGAMRKLASLVADFLPF